MILKTQQILAGISFGGAIATVLAVTVPQIVAGQPAPVIAQPKVPAARSASISVLS